jgi:hypothetical protein
MCEPHMHNPFYTARAVAEVLSAVREVEKGVKMKYYQILERTPYSKKCNPSRPFQPLAVFQIQMAEYDLKLNETSYYEHAVQTREGTFLYPFEIAECIAHYWKQRYPFADYQLQERSV